MGREISPPEGGHLLPELHSICKRGRIEAEFGGDPRRYAPSVWRWRRFRTGDTLRHMTTNALWGPLAGLIGEWEGDEGLDVSFHNTKGAVHETKYRERVTLEPFGPVANGTQNLYGLDYRMAAWRPNEDSPFHTEIGYWLWDAETGHVMRCFMVPRGTTLLAGGTAKPTDAEFSLEAAVGSEVYGILSSHYLTAKARTTKYTCKVVVGAGSLSYDSVTTYVHATGGEIAHTDRNTLRRVAK